jgi:hypothetical protein
MLLWVTRIALLGAALSAVALARRRADHWPVAAFLVWLVGVDVLRATLILRFDLVRPLGAPPLEGAARLAFHADQAIELSWAAGIAAIAILSFSRRSWPALLVALAWAGTVAYLATHYPAIRGDALRLVYLGTELPALLIAAGLIMTWTWRRERPTPARICVLALCVTDSITLFAGAWRWGFWSFWSLQQAAFALTYTTIAGFQVIMWKLI